MAGVKLNSREIGSLGLIGKYDVEYFWTPRKGPEEYDRHRYEFTRAGALNSFGRVVIGTPAPAHLRTSPVDADSLETVFEAELFRDKSKSWGARIDAPQGTREIDLLAADIFKTLIELSQET